MRIGVLSDVHANLPALEAALDGLGEAGVDAYACLGDVVGYGPQPDACVERVAALGATCVAGNHDLVALGRAPLDRCGPLAAETLAWTRRVLGADARAILAALPLAADLGPVRLAHGAPGDPWRYLWTAAEATDALRALEPGPDHLLVGHTHRPLVASLERGALPPGPLTVAVGERLVANPGSVGQSRERRARARFAVLDLGAARLDLHAVRYDVARCRRELRRAGLPEDACHPAGGRLARLRRVTRAWWR